MHKRTPKKSGGRQPAVGVETSLHRHERDCPQDRRWCVCVCVDGPPLLCTVYRRPLASAGGHQSAARFVIHGELTPPALVLRCECLPAKNDFFDTQTHTEKERRALARRASVNRTPYRENRTLSSG
jgi:hypothetical protein